MHMIWLDYFLLAIVLLSAIFGLWRGLVREIVAVLTWIVMVLAMLYYAPILAPNLHIVTTSPVAQRYLSYIILFVVIFVLGWLLGRLVNGLVMVSGLSFINRILGGVFGLIRGLIILLLIVYFVSLGAWQNSQLWKHSQIANWLGQVLIVIENQYDANKRHLSVPATNHDSASPGPDKAD